MNNAQQREAARQFSQKWDNRGKEDEDARSYWIEILQNILGVSDVTDRIDFEKKVVVDGNVKRIDAYIPETCVLIEQKSLGVDLDKSVVQSGGVSLTPYEQAKRYNDNLPTSEKAKWIVVSDFREIRIYNMDTREPDKTLQIIDIKNLQTEFERLDFLVKREVVTVSKEERISKEAGAIVKKLYEALLSEYKDKENEDSLRALNILCVRLVFCMYAEDAVETFPKHGFLSYMRSFPTERMRSALIELFKILDTPEPERDIYLDPALAEFPYVNGGLFSEKDIEIPMFNDEIRDILLDEACAHDWQNISPPIFGAIFESTLSKDTRRKGGMHYTSISNIHKVIDPLFLDDIRSELSSVKALNNTTVKRDKLKKLQNKISSLKFLDPASGSGNFLTESYLSLRRVENEIIRELTQLDKKQIDGQIVFGMDGADPVKVSISQFYGIEINDYAVSVAMTALWIAESQMLKETEDIVHKRLDYLPLKSNTNIIEGNALRTDWGYLSDKSEHITIYADQTNVINEDVNVIGEPIARYGEIDLVTKTLSFGNTGEESEKQEIEFDYIMGNPPFFGARLMTPEQKADMDAVFGKLRGVGNLDYVTAWFKKAADYICKKKTKVGFVSTNSISQGEQVAILWKELLSCGVDIDFAYRTFVWDNEAADKAHVHVVIVGFSGIGNKKTKVLYEVESEPSGDDKTDVRKVSNINGYLIDGENVFIENRSTALCEEAPQARSGNKPIDDGNYLFEKEEMEEFIKLEPLAEKYFRPWIGSYEFINRKPRYCLWLGDASPHELRKMPSVMERIEKVRDFRLHSKSPGTVKLADRPTRFHVETFLYEPFLVMPLTSSERRRYVPIGFMTPEYLASNLVVVIADAGLYHFGVVTSNVFMAWMRAVCGRLKSDYRITKDNVYNNFPWPEPDAEQKSTIEKTAQAILSARDLYPDSSLADLYDLLTMPAELMKAHTENDRAVMRAYGFDIRSMSEADCVAELMKMYKKLTDNQPKKETS